MSFAKYAQFYKENGFFAGSKIKVTVTDNSFIGKELVLTKGSSVIRSTTIPASGKVDFFTDESGVLTLSANNGTSTISGTVEIGAYATYEVTLNGSASDTMREAYAKDVTMNDTTAVANISYTGDVSGITAVNSDPSLVSISISGNKITMRDAGNDKSGKCSITATVAGTSKYSSADVTFNVNKLTGTYGSWEDASDEKIASMIAKADAGEIDLADYWNIGDTRRVHLNAIEAGIEVAEQVEQDIDLVIMHNPLGDSKYMLTNPTAGNRYQPHFIIGTKDCLENKSVMGYYSKTINSSSGATTNSYTSYVSMDESQNCELIDILNDKFILALPQYLQTALKLTDRRYVYNTLENQTLGEKDKITYTAQGTKANKVSLVNLKELGLSSNVARGDYSDEPPSGVGIYTSSGTTYNNEDKTKLAQLINNQINNCGTKFTYFNDHSITKNKGVSGGITDYLILETLILSTVENTSYTSNMMKLSMAFFINESGEATTNNLNEVGQRSKLRGVSPIMFI